jgi:sortase A
MLNPKLIPVISAAVLAISLAGLAWIFAPVLFTEVRYQEQVKLAAGAKPLTGFSRLLTRVTGFQELVSQGSGQITPVSPEFSLVIPRIFANVAVTENVNPQDKSIYQSVLKQAGGVAHAAGSALPGEPGTVYIFGHSTDATINVERFNAVFYLLRKLEAGDEIIIYYKNTPYKYIVSEKKTVNPDDISDITNVTNQPRLVLQTCWPPGTTWKRLLVIAQPQV